VLRAGERIRMLSRRGNDLTERFPSVVKALEQLEEKSCLIDGELVVCNDQGPDGFSGARSQAIKQAGTVSRIPADEIEASS
jgi:ATP-dependent DNA ligase